MSRSQEMSTDLDENQQQNPDQVDTQIQTQTEGASGEELEEEAVDEESAAPDIGFAFDADVDRCMVRSSLDQGEYTVC